MFALDMYRQLAEEAGQNEDIFFSPVSVLAAMSIATAGAAGNTGEELARALGTENTTVYHEQLGESLSALADDPALNMANAIWVNSDYSLRDSYTSMVEKVYGAEAENIDVSFPEKVKALVDGWINEETDGIIDDVIPLGVINGDLLALITNAIVMTVKWETQFDPKETFEQGFTLASGEGVSTLLMSQYNTEVRYAQDQFDLPEYYTDYVRTSGWKSVTLPFAGSDLEMICVLPRNSDLDTVVANLTSEDIERMASVGPQELRALTLPKWKTDVKYSLVKAFKALGVEEAFGPGADFSEMTRDVSPYIVDVIHKASAAVDEEGAKMAAATVVVMGLESCMSGPSLEFVANEEMLYIVRDPSTGYIAFMGRVSSPHLSEWEDEEEEAEELDHNEVRNAYMNCNYGGTRTASQNENGEYEIME